MNVITFNHVWKKFKKGEKLNSLRDVIPSLFRKRNGLQKEEFWAVQDVDFEVEKGDVLGIIGPNGAGKSTILKLLSRIMPPNKGDINIQGRLSALIEVTAGFHDELTGRENIYLNGTILGMTRKEIDSKLDEIIEFSGIREFIDTPVKRYSSGMYSRLGFSVAAHMDPDVLLVDEVLAVGDIAFQAKCAQKMRELLKSNTTIILVSHNLSLIQSLCKRVILLNKGTILMDETPEEVIPYYQDIVSKQSEEELRKKISAQDYRVRVAQDSLVKITNVTFTDGNGTVKESFKVGESISITIEYDAKEKIEEPIFSLEIIRTDGVLCCVTDMKENGFVSKAIQGKGKISINFTDINLAPNIYLTKISIWDKDMINSFVVRKSDVLKINREGSSLHSNAIFLPKIIWK